MTRKHFIHLAKIIQHWSRTIEQGIPVTPTVIAYDLAMFCQSHNPGFDHERFMRACQTEKEK